MRDDIAAALKDPAHGFNRSEVAYLMAVAYRWGYEHRVDEENGLCWDDETRLTFGEGRTVTVGERVIFRETHHRRAS